MRRFIASLFLAGTALLAFTIPASATGGSPPADNTNEVTYWCGENGGVKFDPVSTPFVVPAPPDGYTWTLLVLKAGSTGHGDVINENETFPNPVVGQSYTHSSGKDLSHAILCKTASEGTTTVPQETTTTTATTLPTTTTVATTVPETTTTVAQTTTTGNVGICCLQAPPTTVAETTTTAAPATTAAPTTVAATVPPAALIPPAVVEAPAKPSLPVTGAMTGREVAMGAALILIGLAAVLFTKKVRSL